MWIVSYEKYSVWVSEFRFNSPVNNISVMLRQSPWEWERYSLHPAFAASTTCSYPTFSQICRLTQCPKLCSTSCTTQETKKNILTLKAPITTAANDNFFFFFYYLSEKTSLDISCESSADNSHKISRLVFSEKKKKKKFECRLLQILLGALRVNAPSNNTLFGI